MRIEQAPHPNPLPRVQGRGDQRARPLRGFLRAVAPSRSPSQAWRAGNGIKQKAAPRWAGGPLDFFQVRDRVELPIPAIRSFLVVLLVVLLAVVVVVMTTVAVAVPI